MFLQIPFYIPSLFSLLIHYRNGSICLWQYQRVLRFTPWHLGLLNVRINFPGLQFDVSICLGRALFMYAWVRREYTLSLEFSFSV